jgi:adenylate cyclase, class 2
MKMRYEVEQKHRLPDLRTLVAQLEQRGASLGAETVQLDQYFAHPCRNFAKTDEALRIRTVGDKSYVTYKGPKLDTATKTRRELELPLDSNDGDGSRFAELLGALGFKPVAVVRKRRRSFRIRYDELDVEGALDEVDQLGAFVELELPADDTILDEAKRVISTLATELDLGPSERRSYLEMLLEKNV